MGNMIKFGKICCCVVFREVLIDVLFLGFLFCKCVIYVKLLKVCYDFCFFQCKMDFLQFDILYLWVFFGKFELFYVYCMYCVSVGLL